MFGSVLNLAYGVPAAMRSKVPAFPRYITYSKEDSNSPEKEAKSIPIHCVVETFSGSHGDNSVVAGGGEATIELDTYAILPSTTLFSEIVRTALVKLGYTAAEAMGAKGAIQIKNWKPLTFDTVTENPDSTVEDILGDLTSMATLRIRLGRSSLDTTEWTDQAVRCAVIELLKEMNQCRLAKLSPLSQSMISNIANSKYSARICTEKCKEFALWYTAYRSSNKDELFGDGTPKDSRLTFHPIYELPKMREWYRSNKSPTDITLRHFLDEINNGPVRQERQKITLNKLKIWWKNEKQREKRGQQKKVEKDMDCVKIHRKKKSHERVNVMTENQVPPHSQPLQPHQLPPPPPEGVAVMNMNPVMPVYHTLTIQRPLLAPPSQHTNVT